MYADTSKAKLATRRRPVVERDVDVRARAAQIGGYDRYKGVIFGDDRVAEGLVVTLKY